MVAVRIRKEVSVENKRGNVKVTLMPGGRYEKRQRVVTVWRCRTCGTDHHSRAAAERCSTMPVEPRLFKRGDRVGWREHAVCDHRGGRPRTFAVRGTVTRVGRPEPPDEEYSLKWLGGRLAGQHVRLYEVKFSCRCGRPRSMLLYALEMGRQYR